MLVGGTDICWIRSARSILSHLSMCRFRCIGSGVQAFMLLQLFSLVALVTAKLRWNLNKCLNRKYGDENRN